MKVTGAMSKTTELFFHTCKVLKNRRRKGRLKSLRFATERGEHIIVISRSALRLDACMPACPKDKEAYLIFVTLQEKSQDLQHI